MKTKTTTETPTPAEPPPAPHDALEERLAALAAENAELRSAIDLGHARDAIVADLTAAGARSPRLLFDAVKGEINIAPDGSVAGRGEIVERLKAAFPEQFAVPLPTSIDAGAGRTASAVLTRETLAKMTPAEIAALDWQAVKHALASR
ncbi:MAG: hypothetical protein K1X36_14490 [Pyrinomonadaceae bacterium]|nr:hypothetical protein [Pyrinomonadaceae bacterium]